MAPRYVKKDNQLHLNMLAQLGVTSHPLGDLSPLTVSKEVAQRTSLPNSDQQRWVEIVSNDAVGKLWKQAEKEIHIPTCRCLVSFQRVRENFLSFYCCSRQLWLSRESQVIAAIPMLMCQAAEGVYNELDAAAPSFTHRRSVGPLQ